MEILIDANIVVAIILDEPIKPKIIALTEDADLVSSDILPHEVGNALSALYKRKRITQEEVIKAYALFETIPVRFLKVKVAEALKISCEYCIYAYDAYYLELAKRLRLPVLTYDTTMKNAGIGMKLNMMGG
jgi:predicted nucleic acid-binding protein